MINKNLEHLTDIEKVHAEYVWKACGKYCGKDCFACEEFSEAMATWKKIYNGDLRELKTNPTGLGVRAFWLHIRQVLFEIGLLQPSMEEVNEALKNAIREIEEERCRNCPGTCVIESLGWCKKNKREVTYDK